MASRTTRGATVEAKRRLILIAAVKCFVEQGFHQTSIRDIAERAGVSVGNLYNHFAGKESLIAEIASLEAADVSALSERLEAIANPVEAIDRFIVLYAEYFSQRENIVLTAEIIAECLRNPEIGAGFVTNRTELVATLARRIKMAARELDLTLAGPPVELANPILDVVEGLAMRAALAGRKPTDAEIKAAKSVTRRIAFK